MARQLEKKPVQTRVPLSGKAVIYIRVSSDRQADGASLAVQKEACQRYCEEHGLEVVGVFKDVESGLHNGRLQYKQALELAAQGGIDRLIVWRFDRLGRDSHEYIGQLKGLKRAGVDVVSVTQPTESMFMQQMLGVMAEEESRQISVRTFASKQRGTRGGYWQSGSPFGYVLKKTEGGTVLEPHPEHGTLVTKLFARYATGKVSLWSLRSFLAEHGIKKSIHGLSYVLRNPLYLGRIRYGHYARSPFTTKPEVTEYEGQHEPLTTPQIFQRVGERLSANLHRRRGGPSPRYLFSGLLFCGSCGCRFVGKKKVEKRAGRKGGVEYIYRCGRKVSVNDCKSHSVHEGRLRAAVLEPLKVTLSALSVDAVRAAVRLELEKEAEAARKQTSGIHEGLIAAREKLEARLSKLEDAYLDGIISKARYISKRDQFQAEISDLKGKLSSLPVAAPMDTKGILALAESITLNNLDAQGWRDIVEAVVDSIIVKNEGEKRKATVEVHWKAGFDVVARLAEGMRDA